ncbi:MAG: PTS sugar transporter subunit IIA [Defluviicoccus sp.]|nr:PTS sugar transporter subunit IIA [Defluviicoccus sp.]MDE0279165.1 PTS sugar transporter subunit IIA [Defluviicoccus sp.]
MDIGDLLTSDGVVDRLPAASKKQVIQEISRRAAEMTGLDERAVFSVLLERERLGTTGVGEGVAIPHGKIADLDGLCGLFVRLDGAVDFDSIDDRPVDLVFLLLAQEGASADHLKALARVSRLMRDPEVRDGLRSAADADALYAVLTSENGVRAA